MSNRYHVLIVGNDREVLPQLARLLQEFGYSARVACDVCAAEAAALNQRADILIAEASSLGPDGLARCQAACQGEDAAPVYTCVLTEARDPRELKKAVEKGADDFLHRPLIWGEVLARMRAASRVIELERRLRELIGVDRLTGLATRTRFVERTEQALSDGAAAVIVVALDSSLAHPSREAVTHIAEALGELCDRTEQLAHLGAGRFAVLQPDENDDQAAAWAERARSAIALGESRDATGGEPWTVSLGVAYGNGLADELLSQAEAACAAAQLSGGNVVFRHEQAIEAERQWQELRLPGRLFERTTAREVMIPCSVLLNEDDTCETARVWLDRTGAEGLAVVHADGRLAGWLSREAVGEVIGTNRVGEVVDPDVATCEEKTSFTRLMELFTSDGRAEMIVTRSGRPSGIVARRSLADLIEPADRLQLEEVPWGAGTQALLIG